ncbi:MAG: hypothetical protein E6I81_03395 [Chloroflexi bacterium]|nr:MAG: hypothetical protein E6I81_03395 [Chloroflexota bacterium]
MRIALALALLGTTACGSVNPSPVSGSPLNVTQLKFAVMDAVGRPVYCDPDFYPIAREGGEQASAISTYPQMKADAETYAAIVAHEHLPYADLTDAQKLVVYRAWKLLRALNLTQGGSGYSFQYRIQPSAGKYQMVGGTVRVDGVVTISSRTAVGAPNCPICLAASTLIATPHGQMRVTDVRVGQVVWTQTADGRRIAEPAIEVGSMPVPQGHLMVHLVLADGRELLASPGHRTADGRALGDLQKGDELDGSTITHWALVPYAGERTYDLLPAGPTGRYWANGILLSSTLSR